MISGGTQEVNGLRQVWGQATYHYSWWWRSLLALSDSL